MLAGHLPLPHPLPTADVSEDLPSETLGLVNNSQPTVSDWKFKKLDVLSLTLQADHCLSEERRCAIRDNFKELRVVIPEVLATFSEVTQQKVQHMISNERDFLRFVLNFLFLQI